MAHENTITFGYGPLWVVIPTVKGKKKYKPEEAIEAWHNGQLDAFGIFSSRDRADKYAQERSKTGSTAKKFDSDVYNKYLQYIQSEYGYGMDSNQIQVEQNAKRRGIVNDTAPFRHLDQQKLFEAGILQPRMPMIGQPGQRLFDPYDPLLEKKIEREKAKRRPGEPEFELMDYRNPFPSTIE